MAYYGDLSNDFLGKHTGKRWTKKREIRDIENRKLTLNKLKRYGSHDFNQKNYEDIRDLVDVFKEATADVFSGPLSLFDIGDKLVGLVAPDMQHYWNPDTEFGSEVRLRVTTLLEKAIKADDDILLIAHSLGSIVSYDVLWKFSHYAEYRHIRNKKINTLITIGSPLGDENVKRQLKGSQAKNRRRYPHNIEHWINFAAEDDYISHDPTLANDYKKMAELGLSKNISDQRIYNMAVRDGSSNPHHGSGYLIHPQMSRVLKTWLA